ncbi:MAG: hypothetical protein JXR37_30875 [Kiritimatiellae bacterium]|nr:hypothetical protein [Kiritimatiellia bacterium]
MKITSDWHLHSRNSCDCADAPVTDLIRQAARQGIVDYGLADHYHTPYNRPDIEAARREYLAAEPSAHFRFGIEVSCVSRWELEQIAAGRCAHPVHGVREGGPPGGELAIGLDAADLKALGVEYVIGAAHWPMYVPIEREPMVRSFHRQQMFLAANPLVDIVAHPWWWRGGWNGATPAERPWFGAFSRIPASMHEEFAAALRQNGKAAEINLAAILGNPFYPAEFKREYGAYLAGLKEAGVTFSMGSDYHNAESHVDFDATAALLDSLGIRDEDLWRLAGTGGD